MTWFEKFGRWWKDKVSDNFRSETRDNNEGMGRFLNGIDNLWNKWTGSGLTGAEREANAYSAAMAEDQYAREVEFFEKYQSPKAQMEQGINPFGVSGGVGRTSGGGSPQSVQPQQSSGFGGLFEVVQSIFGMTQQKRMNDAQIDHWVAQAQNERSQSSFTDLQRSLYGGLTESVIAQNWSGVARDNASVQQLISQAAKNAADEKVALANLNLIAKQGLWYDSEISLNGANLSKIIEEKNLIIQKQITESFNRVETHRMNDQQISESNQRIEEIKARISKLGHEITNLVNDDDWYKFTKEVRKSLLDKEDASFDERLGILKDAAKSEKYKAISSRLESVMEAYRLSQEAGKNWSISESLDLRDLAEELLKGIVIPD